MELKDLTLDEIQKIFWEAMRNGWANENIQKQTNSLLPGYKLIPYRSGKFYVLDAYGTHPLSKKSAGNIKIWFDNIPVWFMNYDGVYPEHVIPFLKLALLANIETGCFVGGRGPESFIHKDYPNLSYINIVPLDLEENHFHSFHGTECICENGRLIGQHYYHGKILI